MNSLPERYDLPGPADITRREIPNGIVVLSRPNFNSASVVIDGYLPAGSLFDPDAQLGLADFTAGMLMRGTEQRGFHEIYTSLESIGAGLGISSGTHTTSFSGRALAEDLDVLIELLSEALRQPAFPAEQVERRRAQLLTSLAIRAQDTSEVASLNFDQLVYPGHPYRRPPDGYPETIQAIQREDLVNFHQRIYGPRGLVIAVVGAVEPEQALEKVARALGDWQNPRQPALPTLPAWQPLEHQARAEAAIPGKVQSDLIIGTAGPPRLSPDFIAAALGNSIFGQFGMMGRIGASVREKAGLAYYAGSSLGGGLGPGPWDVAAGVHPTNVEQAIALILAEIHRFVHEPVTSEELADSQAQFIGQLPLSMESNSGVAARLVHIERYQLGLDYYQRYPEIVRRITPQEILETAQRYLDPERLAISIAGPEI